MPGLGTPDRLVLGRFCRDVSWAAFADAPTTQLSIGFVHRPGLRTSCEPHWWPLCCWLGGFGYVSLFSQGCVLPVWSGGESVKDEPVQIIVKILHKLLGCVLFGANSTGVKFALDGAEEPFYSGVVAAVAEPG